MPPSGAARVWPWLVCLVVQLVAIRNMWIDERLVDGQVLRGVFEDPRGRPELALTDCCGEEFFPGPGLDAHGALAVSPGLIAVAILDGGGTFVVKTDASTPTPYLVFGTKRPEAGTNWLADARRIDAGAAGLQLVAWDGGQSWRADASWLAALSERCGGADAQTVRVSITTDHADVRIGSCPPVAVRIGDGTPPLMAVVAGPSWLTVDRVDTGYRAERRLNTGTLVPLSILAAVSVVGLGAMSVGVLGTVSASLLAVSFLVPFAAWAGFLVVLLFVVFTTMLRMAVRIVPFRRRWMRTSIGTMGAGIGLLILALVLRRTVGSTFSERHWTEGEHDAGARCRLVGYSPIDNAQLRAGAGISEMLAKCPACAGGLDVSARHGGRLDWTREQVCSPELAGGTKAIVAMGGNNDDMLWAQGAMDYAKHAGAMLRFGMAAYDRTVRPDYLARTIETFAESAMKSGEDQTAALRAAAQCADDRGARFVFVHDFFIEDLAHGRSATRQALLERRRDAVAPDGRRRFFIDALEDFSDMGISWFNDMRHPSLIGHRKLAERVCEIFRR